MIPRTLRASGLASARCALRFLKLAAGCSERRITRRINEYAEINSELPAIYAPLESATSALAHKSAVLCRNLV